MGTTGTYPLRCQCRRKAPTGLRCARCSIPICPDCSRVAPAGMLCQSCATGTPLTLYQTGPEHVLRGLIITLPIALFGGWLFATLSGIRFFLLWIGFLYGIAVAEINLRATGRKRGRAMEIVVGACCLTGILGGLLLYSTLNAPDRTGFLHSILADPWVYAAIGCALFGSIGRIRHY
ncbi:MAG: hypothetical protein RMJ43_15685 [Chloroherpetonaceae bacterium]|nr:hypothetical protein [Chthonomonadaceae bacterium]MDW8209276.1 hypothetical protein [Chloroherpetonaceae bacterium]